jgi:hypothetical protein
MKNQYELDFLCPTDDEIIEYGLEDKSCNTCIFLCRNTKYCDYYDNKPQRNICVIYSTLDI